MMGSRSPPNYSHEAVYNMIVDHMQKARVLSGGREDMRLMHLRAAKELILTKNPDLIDNFWNEMLATRHDRSLATVTFCLEWIQEACEKEALLLKEKDVISIVLQLMEHQSVIVQKRSLLAVTQIYRTIFSAICSSNMLESKVKILWGELARLKEHIAYAVGEEEQGQSHVGYRLLCYKFIETVILCQSPRDPVHELPASGEDPVSSLDIPEKFQLVSRKVVEREANDMFELLENHLIKQQLSVEYIDCTAICGCLFQLGKRRSQYLPRIITAVEFVLSNIPESYSRLQIEGLRKYFKVGLLSVLKRSNDGEMLERTVQLLTRHFGSTQTEIHRNRPNVNEMMKRRRNDSDEETAAKRLKTSNFDEDEVEADTSSHATVPAISDPTLLATDLNIASITPKLTPGNVVELVLQNIRRLPTSMPVQFHASYTPIGVHGPMESIIHHLVRLMAVQMVAAEVGPGPEEVARRRQEESAVQKQLDAADQEEDGQAIPSVVGRSTSLSTSSTALKEGIVDDEGDNDSVDSNDAVMPAAISQTQLVPDAFKATEKAFHVSQITEPIPMDDRGNAILSIVNELISSDASLTNAGGEFLHQKCIIRFAVKIGLHSLRDRIMKFILEDIASRAELAFRWIYEEYAVSRQMKRNPEDNKSTNQARNYDDCLKKFIKGFIDHPEHREGLVSALYLEVPIVTDGAIELLSYYCTAKNLHGAMRLIQKLVTSRPTEDAHRFIVPALEMTLHQRKDIQSQAVQTCVKMYGSIPELRNQISTFAIDSIKLLCDPLQPPPWFFTEKYGRGEKLKDYSWTEELQKLCTTLFTGLLSEDPALLPVLGEIYVDHPSDVKKTIFKVIEQPMKTIGMNAPEMLEFVQNPPKGSESLVLRMIHLLTETHPPTSELISSIRSLYSERIPDVRFLIPILNGLPKEEIFAALPKLIKLNPVVVQEVFHRLLATGKHKLDSTQRKPSVTPAEVLIEIHKIDLTKADAKTLIKATGICLEEKDLYPAETMVEILRALIDVEKLPFLLMRTVLQTIQMHPRLVPFIMNVLQRLIQREVWTLPLLWEGFVKCCEKTMPQSFTVLLQLPAEKLRTIMESSPAVKMALQEHIGSLNGRQRNHLSPQIVTLVETGKVDPDKSKTPIVATGTSGVRIKQEEPQAIRRVGDVYYDEEEEQEEQEQEEYIQEIENGMETHVSNNIQLVKPVREVGQDEEELSTVSSDEEIDQATNSDEKEVQIKEEPLSNPPSPSPSSPALPPPDTGAERESAKQKPSDTDSALRNHVNSGGEEEDLAVFPEEEEVEEEDNFEIALEDPEADNDVAFVEAEEDQVAESVEEEEEEDESSVRSGSPEM